MTKYRLAGAAKGDLVGIIRYGERNYGPEASNAYRDKLEALRIAVAQLQLKVEI